ncbi:MAG: lipase [Gordonia paraffinivorans]
MKQLLSGRRCASILLVGVVAALVLGGPAAAAPSVPLLPALPGVATPPLPPESSIGPSYSDPGPLYRHPPGLASMRDGDVISAVRKPAPPRVLPVETWQIRYKTTDSQGVPMVGVTLVMLPFNHSARTPLLSYQMITNALGMRCQPSQAMYNPLDFSASPADPPGFNLPLLRGWALAIPDHLGERTSYGAVRMSGHVVLDGIRAATRWAPLGLAKSRVALAGYSGGGMATASAAAQQATYAPDVNLVGSVEGGVPTNLEQMAEAIGTDNGHPAFGLAMAAALGLEREYPDRLPVSKQLNWLGLQTRAQMANACTNEILVVGFGKTARLLARNFDLLKDPAVRQILRENSIGFMPETPTAPVFEFHSPTDPLISVGTLNQTMARYCRAGTTVYQLATPGARAPQRGGGGLPSRLPVAAGQVRRQARADDLPLSDQGQARRTGCRRIVRSRSGAARRGSPR